jgi:cell division protease FtsH
VSDAFKTDRKGPSRSTQGPKGANGRPAGDPNRILNYALGAIIAVLLVQLFNSYNASQTTIAYSDFDKAVAAGQVREVTVSGDTIEGDFRAARNGQTHFITNRVDPTLAEKLAARGVTVHGQPPAGWLSQIASWLAPFLLIFLFWIFLAPRLMGGLGGAFSAGRAKAHIYAESDIKVTFADVAGVDEAKFELQEVVNFLKEPKTFGRLGARAPKGILLVGPPGTGKTLLARAVAGEAGVPFFSISGSEFVEMFVGVGAARVRDLFSQARAAAPSIIFIDELDALGRSRTAAFVGGVDEKEQTLNQLLAEIDGFDPSVGVILLAATNRPEILDPALLRAGRFDRQVLVDRPDRTGRLAILKVHVRKIVMDPDLSLDAIAALTTGFTGADLANLANEAAIAATRRNGESVTLEDFSEAIERIIAGAEKRTRVLSPKERRRVAYHEMGHALVAAALPGVDPVQKVSIIPRGVGALGYTMQRPTEDRFLLSRTDLENRVTVLLGGRAAETLIFDGDVSTGAADDLQRATEIAIEMVTRHGMDPGVGPRVYAPAPSPLLMGQSPDHGVTAAQDTAREIDLAVQRIVAEGARRAEALLKTRHADLEAGVALLLTRETLTADDFAPLRREDQDAPSAVPLTKVEGAPATA